MRGKFNYVDANTHWVTDMVLDSLFNKETRILKKSTRLYERGEALLNKNNPQGMSYLVDSFNTVKDSLSVIKERKNDFSSLLTKIGVSLNTHGDFKMALESFKLSLQLNNKNIDSYVNYALAVSSKNDFEHALTLVDKALRIDRKNKNAWEAKAIIYERMGDIDESLKMYLNLINLYPEEMKYYNSYLKHKPNDVDVLFKKGVLLYNRKNYDGCIKVMSEVVDLSPHNKDAFVYLGAAYTKMNKLENAINSFKKALSIDPNDKPSWINLTVIYKKRGEYDNALRCIKEAIKIDPNDPRAWYLKASIEYAMNNYNTALNTLKKSIDLNSDYKEAFLLKREILKKVDIPEEMINTCKRLIEMGERDMDIYYDLALAYFKTKNYNDSLKVTTTILKTSSYHLPTLNLQKEIMKRLGRWDYIIPICETILSIEPKNIGAYMDIALSYEKLEKYESALNSLIQASNIEPKNIEIWKKRKEYAKKLGKQDEIITSSLQIISMTDDYDTHLDLAKAYYSTGRFDECRKILEKALRIKDNDFAWNLLGMAYYKIGDFEKAKNSFENATKINPHEKKYWSNLGWILEKLEKYDEAIGCFDKALSLDSKDMRLWYEKGLCLKKTGKLEESLKSFDEALKINMKFTKALFEKADVLLELNHLEESLNSFNSLLKLEPANHLAMYKRALIRFKKKEFESCLKDIDDALKYERNENYLELKKSCCKEMKNWDCVIKTCRDILAINRKNLSAHRDLAQTYARVGKIDSSIEVYRDALEIFPDNEVFLYELKDILFSSERFADVVDVAKKILSINPEDYKNLIDLSKALINLEKYKDAKEYLLRALNLKKSVEVLILLGDVFTNLKNLNDALKYYQDALNIETNPEIYYKIAKTEYEMNDLKSALKNIRRCLKIEKSAKYYILAAKISLKKNNFNYALKYAKSALNLEDSPQGRLVLGKILFEMGDYDEAIKTLKKIAKEGNVEALKLLASALEMSERYEEAIDIYKLCIEKNKKDADSWSGLGRCYLKINDLDNASKAYERAFLISPDSREICENLAFIYEKLNRYNDSLNYIDKAIGIEPDNKYLWNSKGLLLEKMENYDEAKKAFERALKIDPDFKVAIEGKKDCERIIEEREIEKYARDVLLLEHKTGRRVTKKIAFKKLNIPLTLLPKVFDYIKREEPLHIESLNEEMKRKFERASLTVAKSLQKIEKLKLSDIVAATKLDLKSSKRLFTYINSCLSMENEFQPTQEDERLVRRALDLEIKNYKLLNLMLNLDIGACEAKRVKKLLEEFKEETAEEVTEEVEEEEKKESEEVPPSEKEEVESEEEELRL